jgi:hypothetical protein
MIKELKEKITQHHLLYRCPVHGPFWEDIFDQVINSDDLNWNMGSHTPGPDVVCSSTRTRYQNKSGTVDLKKNTLEWSGHRTTKYKSLDEKLQFLSQIRYDKYAMLARANPEWKKKLQRYYFIIFDSSLIDYSKLNWTEVFDKNANVSGWYGSHPELAYTAKINMGLADQVWTTAQISHLGKLEPIFIEHDTNFFKYTKQS